MKISIILIINEKENLSNKIDTLKEIFNDERYEIILINNLLNNNLDKYYENNKDILKIINLSKQYPFNMNILAGIENTEGNTFICLNNSYNISSKDILNCYHKIKEKVQDQIVYYNVSPKQIFNEQITTIGAWFFNKSVSEALIKLDQKNIKIDFNKIGFNTLKNIDEKIIIKKEEECNYYLIKSKVGFDISIL